MATWHAFLQRSLSILTKAVDHERQHTHDWEAIHQAEARQMEWLEVLIDRYQLSHQAQGATGPVAFNAETLRSRLKDRLMHHKVAKSARKALDRFFNEGSAILQPGYVCKLGEAERMLSEKGLPMFCIETSTPSTAAELGQRQEADQLHVGGGVNEIMGNGEQRVEPATACAMSPCLSQHPDSDDIIVSQINDEQRREVWHTPISGFPESTSSLINAPRFGQHARPVDTRPMLDEAFENLFHQLQTTCNNLVASLNLTGLHDEKSPLVHAPQVELERLYACCFTQTWRANVEEYQKNHRLTVLNLLTSLIFAAIEHTVFAKGSDWQRSLCRAIGPFLLKCDKFQKLWHDLQDTKNLEVTLLQAHTLINDVVCENVADGTARGTEFDCKAAARSLGGAFLEHVDRLLVLASLHDRSPPEEGWQAAFEHDLEAALERACYLKGVLCKSGLEHSLIWPTFRERLAREKMDDQRGRENAGKNYEVLLTLKPGVEVRFDNAMPAATLRKASVLTRVCADMAAGLDGS